MSQRWGKYLRGRITKQHLAMAEFLANPKKVSEEILDKLPANVAVDIRALSETQDVAFEFTLSPEIMIRLTYLPRLLRENSASGLRGSLHIVEEVHFDAERSKSNLGIGSAAGTVEQDNTATGGRAKSFVGQNTLQAIVINVAASLYSHLETLIKSKQTDRAR